MNLGLGSFLLEELTKKQKTSGSSATVDVAEKVRKMKDEDIIALVKAAAKNSSC